MNVRFFFFLILTASQIVLAQKTEYSSQTISDSLKDNANAIIRLDQKDITISSQRNMSIHTKRVVTVLNEKGISVINAFEYYNKTTAVRNLDALILDASGTEIKRIKRKDFKDHSAVNGSTLFSDDRVLYLEYTPIMYPFTVIFTSETETSNTAFIPQWFPLSAYNVSVEKSLLNVNFPSDLGFKKKERNITYFNIVKLEDTTTQLSYAANGITAQKFENYSPAFTAIFPNVMMGLEKFHLENVDGDAKTWSTFGKWYFDKILAGTNDLSEETKVKMQKLVGDEQDPIKKAKIIYNYVQQKSRYVNVSIGIGGWKPMLADDVDRLGYGDCKALTNYTKALLETVGVPSYNVILYGDSSKRSIESDFVSMQGNHMMLAIPNHSTYVWLECTSQDAPFGYQGTFTDDRDVLVVKPDGGEVVRTNIYQDVNNEQVSKGYFSISEKGDLSGNISLISRGTRYNLKSEVENLQPEEKDEYYKSYWENINNLKFEKVEISTDKDNVICTENAKLSAVNYGELSANKIIFVVNAYNQIKGNVKRIRSRKNPFEIQRGYSDKDEIEIKLPLGHTIEFVPHDFELKTKFGEYKTEVIKSDSNSLIYKRTMFLKEGMYVNKEYDDFRLFIDQISRNDNAKIILTKP